MLALEQGFDSKEAFLTVVFNNGGPIELLNLFVFPITLVLVNVGGKELTTPINGHTECAFIWHTKEIPCTIADCDAGINKFSSLDLNSFPLTANIIYNIEEEFNSAIGDTIYDSSPSSLFLAIFFRLCFPSYISDITKIVENKSYDFTTGEITSTYDKFFYPAIVEVTDLQNNSDLNSFVDYFSQEGEFWNYYTNPNNLIKILRSPDLTTLEQTPTAYGWLLRSLLYGYYYFITDSGALDYILPQYIEELGLAPFGCI